jgi:hypothetical protein
MRGNRQERQRLDLRDASAPHRERRDRQHPDQVGGPPERELSLEATFHPPIELLIEHERLVRHVLEHFFEALRRVLG